MFATDVDVSSLVRGIKEGNEDSFREFFFLSSPHLFRFLYRYTHDRDLAEDLTQETYVSYWQARSRLDHTIPPQHYLYRIARNLALCALTRRKQASPLSRFNEDTLVNLSANPEETYARSLACDEVQKSLSLLPERCRAVFILSRYDDLSYQEIAEALQISVQTVKNQMNKALAILRKRLAEYANE